MNSKYFSSICCFLTLFALIVALSTIVTTSIPYVSASDYGLVSKLPLFYWVGLSAILVLLYLGRASTKWLSIVFVLIILYLFVVPVVVQENATLLGISYPASEGSQLTITGKLPEDLYSIYKYHNFPGFLYFSAAFTSITGVPLALICKYVPPFFVTLIGIIVYSILRVKLTSATSLMGALWFLASWWWVAGNYFSPQEVAFVLFGLVFLIFTKFEFGQKPRSRSLFILLILMSMTIIFTHAFTSIMLLSCFIPLLLFQKRKNRRILVLLWFVLELSYLCLWAFPFTEYALSTTLHELPTLLGNQFGRAQLIGSLPQILTNYFRYFTMLISIAVLIIFVSMLLIKRKKNIEKYWLLCLIGMALPLAVTAYGLSETIIRVFMFALIPLSYVCVKFFSKKPALLAVIVCVLIMVNIPSRYGGATVEGVATSEIQGASFYINHVAVDASYFSLVPKTTYLMWFESPYSVNFPMHLTLLSPLDNQTVSTTDLKEYQFIIYSQGEVNQYLYYHGRSPLNVSTLEPFSKVYDNQFVTIYSNNAFVPFL